MKSVTRSQQNNIVGLKELRTNLGKYLSRIDKGESFTVVRRSQPVFKITPVEEDAGEWETVFDAARDNNGKGIKAAEVVKILKKMS